MTTAPEGAQCRRMAHASASLVSDLRRGKGKEGVDRCLERFSAPLHLGEEKSPLEHSEESDSEKVGFDIGRERPERAAPLGFCALHSGDDHVAPGSEPFLRAAAPPDSPRRRR